jgi:hypothetical protein
MPSTACSSSRLLATIVWPAPLMFQLARIYQRFLPRGQSDRPIGELGFLAANLCTVQLEGGDKGRWQRLTFARDRK